jgi:hypothetical protein
VCRLELFPLRASSQALAQTLVVNPPVPDQEIEIARAVVCL